MAKIFYDIKTNYIFMAAGLSWFSAQVIKTFINFFITKKFDAERLVGAGGMPSAHSACVSALAIATGRQCGCGSAEFAIAFAFACVVIYDAMGVRRAAGEQAKVINQLTDSLFKNLGETKIVVSQLKELLGHTPVEVFGGIILGVTIATLFKGF